MSNENEMSPEEVVRQFKKNQGKKRQIWLVIFLILIVIFIFNYGQTSKNFSVDSKSLSSPADTSWIPVEFNSWTDDSNIAWRWLDSKEYTCSGDGCWGIMVISKNGCQNGLYAEISILDKNDVQVGFTNDSLSSALPMQKSKLIFDTFEKSAHSARISKIHCY